MNLPTEVQKCWWAYNVFMHRLLRRSQTRIVLSSLADTKYLPPGWNDKPLTQLSWPVRVKRQSPTLTSQTFKINIITNMRILKFVIYLQFGCKAYAYSFISWARCKERTLMMTLLVISSCCFINSRCSCFRGPGNTLNCVIVIA